MNNGTTGWLPYILALVQGEDNVGSGADQHVLLPPSIIYSSTPLDLFSGTVPTVTWIGFVRVSCPEPVPAV
jgi:hypothetical protein